MVNEFHLSYLRDANNVGQPQGGVGPASPHKDSLTAQAIPPSTRWRRKIEGIENVSFNDFTLGVDTTGLNGGQQYFSIVGQLLQSDGNAHFQGGGGIPPRPSQYQSRRHFNGSFSFTGAETGSDFADFLLGVPSSYAQGDSLAFYLRNQYAGIYAQDSWRVRPHLTLNYGLRWDMLPPWREKYNQLQTLVLGEQSRVYPGAPQGLVFPGDPGIPVHAGPDELHGLCAAHRRWRIPRISARAGWASYWAVRASSSMRAGFGMYYTAFEGLSAGIMSANPPYGYDYTSLAPPLFSDPFVTAASGQNIGQRFPEPIPALGASAANPNSSVDWAQYLPITGVPSFFHQNVPPYSASYTLSFERQ